MRTRITELNIDDFRAKKTFDNIIEITWDINESDESIIKNFPNLQKLNYSYKQITSLVPLTNCVNLQRLCCYGNQITSLDSLASCVNLQKLCCNENQITSLDPLANCINLQRLDCYGNQITSLPLIFCQQINKGRFISELC